MSFLDNMNVKYKVKIEGFRTGKIHAIIVLWLNVIALRSPMEKHGESHAFDD